MLPRGQDSREQRADNARTRPRAGQGRTGRTERTGRPLAFLLGAGLTLPWGLAGCTCSEPADEEPSGAASQLETSEAAPSAAVPVQHQSRISILDLAPRCDLHHGGLVLDLGSTAADESRSFRLIPETPFERLEHEGLRYARLTQLQTKFLVWLPEPVDDLEFSAQVYGGSSERIAAYLDDTRLGAAKIRPDRSQIVRIRARKGTIPAGRHELIVSLSRRRGADPQADLSWVRLGPPLSDPADTPPARDDVFSEMMAGEEQRGAVILRHGSSVECPIWVPEGAELHTSLGIWGSGGGLAEVAVRRSSGVRTIERRVRLEAEDAARGWHPLTVDLSQYGGQAVELELSAQSVGEGARLGFAEPTVKGPVKVGHAVPTVRRVIVFVLSGLGRQHGPQTAAQNGLPTLGALMRSAELFTDYRAPSTNVASVIASLLSGRQPWDHGLEEENQTLPADVSGLAEALQAAGGHSAYFTGVPLSFEGFGFARGFEKFSSTSPVVDRAATAPLDDAENWLLGHRDDERRSLVVIHLRGGHPPFDIDRETARTLPPAEYGGDLSARRSAIQLAEVRGRHKNRQRMPEEDWTRFFALQKAALLKQDARLSAFLSWLQATGLDQDALLIFLGDVASGERPNIPFALDAPLEEEYLQTLLMLRHPGGAHAGESVPLAFTTVDVTRTIAAALGLELPALWPQSLDLRDVARRGQTSMRAEIAFRDGRYATRLGPYLLRGVDGKPPSLCLVTLDPGCVEDRSATDPIATRALWTSTWQELHAALSRRRPAPARPEDPDLEAALTVWGVPR